MTDSTRPRRFWACPSCHEVVPGLALATYCEYRDNFGSRRRPTSVAVWKQAWLCASCIDELRERSPALVELLETKGELRRPVAA